MGQKGIEGRWDFFFRMRLFLWEEINTCKSVDPAFRFMRFPLDGELDFYFEKLILLIIWKWLGVATYFCFIFLKGKQNKKEKP